MLFNGGANEELRKELHIPAGFVVIGSGAFGHKAAEAQAAPRKENTINRPQVALSREIHDPHPAPRKLIIIVRHRPFGVHRGHLRLPGQPDPPWSSKASRPEDSSP